MLGRNGGNAYAAIEELYREGELDVISRGENTSSTAWALHC
jgi:NAD(P)H-hydrate repair Nnr-like enzyme with NAD(P)H-hydrate epimerase domain